MHKKRVNLKGISKLLAVVGFAVVFVGADVLVKDAQGQVVSLVNGGFEQAGDVEKKAFGWHDFGCGYTRVKARHSGEKGIRLVNNDGGQCGAYQRIDLNQTEQKPVAISGYVRGRDINNSPGGYLGASLYAEIHMQDGSVAYWNSVGNYGSFGWRWIGFNTGTVSFIDKPIDYIFVVPILANATGRAFFDDISVQEITSSGAAATLMFDDGEATTLTEAKPVLDGYGFKGSMAIIAGMVGEDGFLTWSDLSGLQTDGWETVSHGITHNDLTTMSIKNARRELNSSKRKLEKKGLTVKNFAMPYGSYNTDILAWAAKKYGSARAYEQGMNPMGVYPFDVKVKGVLVSTTPAEIASWLEQAKNEGKWLVIVFHSIADEGDDAYHIAPDVFAEMVAEVADSGLSVITYDQGIQEFGLKQ